MGIFPGSNFNEETMDFRFRFYFLLFLFLGNQIFILIYVLTTIRVTPTPDSCSGVTPTPDSFFYCLLFSRHLYIRHLFCIGMSVGYVTANSKTNKM